MHVQLDHISETKVKLTITADQNIINSVKQSVLQDLGRDVKIQGFRAGKAPETLVEKNVDPSRLQTDFLEKIVNHLYIEAIRHERLKPIAQPQVTISKFVPYSSLEFFAEVEVIGKVVLPDYKKIKITKQKVAINADDIKQVLNNLLTRAGVKKPVKKASKSGDEIIIDFSGNDAKTDEPISGADGKDYPLIIGSNTFIPGFEDNLIGLKAGETADFTLTFPKDYNVVTLRSRKVKFAVSVKSVNEIELPKLNDEFAATVGPFKTVAELKDDIKKQLSLERERTEQRTFENELVNQITDKSEVAVPNQLVDEEVNRLEDEEKRNIAYRGQTWQEHLDQEGITAEQHQAKIKPDALKRVKAGIVLAEIAEVEKIEVTEAELVTRIAALKKQYTDDTMKAELDKPDNRGEIFNRILTEKTLQKLTEYSR
jgi:trigger factor